MSWTPVGRLGLHLLAGAVAVALLSACRKTTKPPVVGEAAIADTAEQVIFDGHSMLTDGGVKRGEMFADTILVFSNQTRFLLMHVRATFNTVTGAPNGKLRGDRGTYDLNNRTLEGFGNVVVESTDGRKLTSNHLRYIETVDQISSDSAYTLIRGSEIQRGIGFTSDPNLSVFQCKRACGGEGLVPSKTFTKP